MGQCHTGSNRYNVKIKKSDHIFINRENWHMSLPFTKYSKWLMKYSVYEF